MVFAPQSLQMRALGLGERLCKDGRGHEVTGQFCAGLGVREGSLFVVNDDGALAARGSGCLGCQLHLAVALQHDEPGHRRLDRVAGCQDAVILQDESCGVVAGFTVSVSVTDGSHRFLFFFSRQQPNPRTFVARAQRLSDAPALVFAEHNSAKVVVQGDLAVE